MDVSDYRFICALAVLAFDGLRQWCDHIAGVFGRSGLNQYDPALFNCYRIVQGAPRHHAEVALAQGHLRSTLESDLQFTLDDEEQLVLIIVLMPGDLSLDLCNFDILVIDSADDLRRRELGTSSRAWTKFLASIMRRSPLNSTPLYRPVVEED